MGVGTTEPTASSPRSQGAGAREDPKARLPRPWARRPPGPPPPPSSGLGHVSPPALIQEACPSSLPIETSHTASE